MSGNGHRAGAARLRCVDLAASGAAGEGRAARLRVPQAAARLAPRGRRELNGKEHVRVQREQRRRIATQQLLVGESARVLRDEEWPRASARPVGEAPGDQLRGHSLESVFWFASGGCHIATSSRMKPPPGTSSKSASCSCRQLPQSKPEERCGARSSARRRRHPALHPALSPPGLAPPQRVDSANPVSVRLRGGKNNYRTGEGERA